MIFPFKSLLGILLLFPQHKVAILNIKYFPVLYTLYIAVWLLYNYHTSSRPLSRELVILCHISAHAVLSLPPIFFKWVRKWLFWALFPPLQSVWPGFDHFQLLFSFSIYVLPSLCLSHLVVQHIVLQFVSTLSTLLHCHCLFHLAGQNAAHHIQTTFAGRSLCCLLC